MMDFNKHSGFVYGATPMIAVYPVSDIVNGAIDIALKAANKSQPARDYLGASRLGEPCARRLAYEYRHERGDDFTGKTLRVFAAGHKFEEMLIDWIRLAGFDIRDKKANGSQYGFETMGGRIKGHIDAVILGGPYLGHDYPLLWECKALNERSWNDLAKKGLAKSKEVYHGQVQLYMGYLELAACLFSALNKNTQEIYHELVRYDAYEAQRLSDRAVDIIRSAEADELPPRISDNEEFFICRWCPYKERCWRRDT